jgi:hypothetical protein
MDFREFAAAETSALIERLTAAAAAQAADARQHAKDEVQKAVDGARKDLKEHTDQLAKSEASLHDVQAKLKSEEGRVTKAAADASAAREQSDEFKKALKQAEKALHDAEKVRDAEANARASAEEELEELRSAVETAREEKADIARRLTALERTLSESDRTRRQLEIKVAATASTDKGQRNQSLDRLLTTFQQLAKATTSAAVLTALVNSLANEFRRVALFNVNGNRLEGMHQVGFDFKSDISKVVMPLNMDSDSLLTQAVASGRVQGFRDEELTEASCAPFGGSPSFVLTVPITVRGQTTAVIYADTMEQGDSEAAHERVVKYAEVLLLSAVPMLTRLSTNDQDASSPSELRNYASLLLDEMADMYNSDVEAGIEGSALTTRLKENLECARRLFAQRIASEGLTSSPLLDEELTALLEANADNQFGHDLTAITTRSSRTAQRKRS